MKGAKTPGSGRKAGTPNRTTAEIKAMAAHYGPEAIEYFAATMHDPERNDMARHLAAKELLDRGYGRVQQAITVQRPQEVESYIRWIPMERLALMAAWTREAKDAMERGEPPPDETPLLPAATEGTVVDEPWPTGTVPEPPTVVE